MEYNKDILERIDSAIGAAEKLSDKIGKHMGEFMEKMNNRFNKDNDVKFKNACKERERKPDANVQFRFDSTARERFVRGVLCDMKGYLDYGQSWFDVTFKRLDYLRNGFGYKMSIRRKENIDERVSYNAMLDRFTAMKNFASDMFEYIFGPSIGVGGSWDAVALTADIEITSEVSA